nr:hypothetical protein GCM10025730_26810 [Promicromonospora thailandica]
MGGTGAAGGEIRTDLDPGRITSWLYLLTDGFLGRAASEEAFSVVAETETLVDTARRFLAPDPARAGRPGRRGDLGVRHVRRVGYWTSSSTQSNVLVTAFFQLR